MFISVVEPYRPTHSTTQIEKMYECDKCEKWFWMDEEPARCLIKMMNNDGQHVGTLDIEKKDIAVYFMNNEGQTIDCIDWLDHRVDVTVEVPKS